MPEYYYGTQTRHAIENFSAGQLPPELIKACAEVKKAAIRAIQETETRWTESVFDAISRSVDEIIDGKLNDQFPLPLQQGGAGTSINMNVNEVIAARALEILPADHSQGPTIDPIEDINRYQSTNDTFPTAVTIVLYRQLVRVEQLVIELQEILVAKENEYSQVLMAGRTEMQDALPITLGQVFASWAGSIERDRWRMHKLKERIRTIALGGTAQGTCFFAPQPYVFAAERHLRNITSLPLSRSQNLTDEIANLDKYSELANGYNLIAQNLYKITGDLLLYTSSFLKEIIHPELQYGSTIMAAKTNPVILEFVRGLALDIQHNCQKINSYCQNGQLQLNAYLPFMLHTFFEVNSALEKAMNAFICKFLNKINVNHERIEENLVQSAVLLNTLLPLIGYNKVKTLYYQVKEEKPGNISDLKALIGRHTHLTKEQLDLYFQPSQLTSFYKELK